MPDSTETEKRLICPVCGQSNQCGQNDRNQEAPCWCMSRPASGLPAAEGLSCLCPACLDRKLREQQRD